MKTYITKIDGRWYAFAGDPDRDRVYSIGADNPPYNSGCDRYTARWTDRGILYVASPSPSRNAARQKAVRGGEFVREV